MRKLDLGTALFDLVVTKEGIVDGVKVKVNCQVHLLMSLAKIPSKGSGACSKSIMGESIKTM